MPVTMTSSSTKKGRSGGAQRSGKAPIERGRWAAKGTKPLPDQASVQHVLSLIVVHGCRKVLFIDTEVKIALYSICLFVGSLFCDFLPLPKVYMGQKDNVFNVYFVKLLWAWLILVVGAFILLTSATIGCGHREVIKRHMSRLLVGTCLWYFWSQIFFGYVENSTGSCLGRAIIKDKYECNNGGFHWHSFDISGHAFILVYVNLLIVEEAKAIMGWEGIRDLIRLEDHKRAEATNNPQEAKTSLENLTPEDLVILKLNYEQFTPIIRCIFFVMTLMSIMSDVMLACTVMFFHTMPQKVAGGAIAMATWYGTYRLWYKCDASPGLPGSGIFHYHTVKERSRDLPNRLRRRSSICKEHKESLPTFMGMPLYGLKKDLDEKKKDNEKDDDRPSFEDFTEPERCSRNGPMGDFFSARSRNYRR